MNRMLAVLLLTCSAIPGTALAATTITIPITVDPGSARFDANSTNLAETVPASFPINSTFGNAPCTNETLSVSISQVGDEIEISATGVGDTNPSLPQFSCEFEAIAAFDIDFTAPEFAGTATVVRLVPEVVAYTENVALESGSVRLYSPTGLFSQTAQTREVATENATMAAVAIDLGQGGGVGATSGSSRAVALPPGDAASGQLAVQLSFSTPTGSPLTPAMDMSITIRLRVETVVPEPSAAMSLPVGMVTLASLAKLRR